MNTGIFVKDYVLRTLDHAKIDVPTDRINQLVENSLVPIVIDNEGRGERAYDIFSRLLKDRIIFINGPIHMGMDHAIIAQMLFLEATDESGDINLYINSPGGEIMTGLAIHDTMRKVKQRVHTLVQGMAASMGAVLLASGDTRTALPNSWIMLHEASGGFRGKTKDAEVDFKLQLALENQLVGLLSDYTGKGKRKIKNDIQKDLWFTPQEALKYGLIDHVYQFAKKHPKQDLEKSED